MARLISRLRQCLIRMVEKPFGFVVAANDYANFLFGVAFLLSVGGVTESSLFQYMTAAVDINYWVWPGLIMIGAVLGRIGFWTKNRILVSTGAMISSVSWLFALFLYIQFGSIWAAAPLVLRPIAIASFTKLKVGLDKDWFDK